MTARNDVMISARTFHHEPPHHEPPHHEPRRDETRRDEARRRPAREARWLAAMALGFSTTFACAAATTQADPATEIHPLTTPLPEGANSGAVALATDAGADGGNKYPGCPHGALEDPHRGFVRCLGPGEKSPFSPEGPGAADSGTGDAGANDSGPSSDAGSAGSAEGGAPGPGADGGSGDAGPATGNTGDAGASADAGPDAGNTDAGAGNTNTDAGAPAAPKPGPTPVVEMKTPRFENGDVPKLEKNLTSKKVLEGIAKCVADAGGLTGKTGSLKVELLVRARGKAEGVEVTPTGVPADAAKCVRALLKDRSVGTPSADPVGVTLTYSLKPATR